MCRSGSGRCTCTFASARCTSHSHVSSSPSTILPLLFVYQPRRPGQRWVGALTPARDRLEVGADGGPSGQDRLDGADVGQVLVRDGQPHDVVVGLDLEAHHRRSIRRIGAGRTEGHHEARVRLPAKLPAERVRAHVRGACGLPGRSSGGHRCGNAHLTSGGMSVEIAGEPLRRQARHEQTLVAGRSHHDGGDLPELPPRTGPSTRSAQSASHAFRRPFMPRIGNRQRRASRRTALDRVPRCGLGRSPTPQVGDLPSPQESTGWAALAATALQPAPSSTAPPRARRPRPATTSAGTVTIRDIAGSKLEHPRVALHSTSSCAAWPPPSRAPAGRKLRLDLRERSSAAPIQATPPCSAACTATQLALTDAPGGAREAAAGASSSATAS
jgi:hypothetical protein